MNAILNRGNKLIGAFIRGKSIIKQSEKTICRTYSMSFPSVPTALPGSEWTYKGQVPTEIKVKKNERVS